LEFPIEIWNFFLRSKKMKNEKARNKSQVFFIKDIMMGFMGRLLKIEEQHLELVRQYPHKKILREKSLTNLKNLPFPGRN